MEIIPKNREKFKKKSKSDFSEKCNTSHAKTTFLEVPRGQKSVKITENREKTLQREEKHAKKTHAKTRHEKTLKKSSRRCGTQRASDPVSQPAWARQGGSGLAGLAGLANEDDPPRPSFPCPVVRSVGHLPRENHVFRGPEGPKVTKNELKLIKNHLKCVEN